MEESPVSEESTVEVPRSVAESLKRLTKLSRYSPVKTMDGVQFDCPTCYADVRLADLVGGGECDNCGESWSGIVLEKSERGDVDTACQECGAESWTTIGRLSCGECGWTPRKSRREELREMLSD